MAEHGTGIEWTHRPGTKGDSWNPVRGCTRVSEGCVNCYAEVMAARFSKPGQWGHGFAKIVKRPDGTSDHRWTGKVALVEDKLTLPLERKQPHTFFVNSTSDLFHESLPDEAIDRVFAVMALAREHTFQILTKRPERMRAYFEKFTEPAMRIQLAAQEINRFVDTPGDGCYIGRDDKFPGWPLKNCWLGTSVEDQATADERIPHLLATPAAIRFVSYEPALGGVDFRRWMFDWGCESCGYGGDQTEDHCPNCGWKGDSETEFAPCPDCGEELTDYYACPECHATNQEGFGVTMSGHTLGYIDQIIAGGESGPKARPAHTDWFRSVRDQCAAAGVAFFFKQWGEWYPQPLVGKADGCFIGDTFTTDIPWNPGGHPEKVRCMAKVGKKKAGALLDGREHREFPTIPAPEAA